MFHAYRICVKRVLQIQRVTKRRWLWAVVVVASGMAAALGMHARKADIQGAGDYVILLHGLGRTHRSMNKLEARLTRAGYRVVNLRLPTRRYAIAQLADDYVYPAVMACGADPVRRVHFVTHSLGGLVARDYIRRHAPTRIGRMVMLSPPHQGSEVADRLSSNALYRTLAGPAGQELVTARGAGPVTPGVACCAVGIIAGDRSLNPLFSAMIPGPDDGKVAVASARMEGMTDFLLLHATHPFIMRNDEAIAQVLTFLERGAFAHVR